MIKMKDLFEFINDLKKIICCIGFKLILKRNSNDRALFRADAGSGAVANDCNIEIRDIACCVPCIDPSNDNRITVQKGLSKKIIQTSASKKKNLQECTRCYQLLV